MNFTQQYNQFKDRIESCLQTYYHDGIEECKTLTDSVKYSLSAGGKRIRPVLMYAVADLIGCTDQKTLDVFAAALEMIHTSSLIHDDLPGMDNDSLRRGVPTNHVVYGEGTAIIAGDTLMFKAFEIAAEHIYKHNPSEGSVKALWMLGLATGYQGMTGGQMIDMESDPEKTGLDRLILMNAKKTGALIDLAIKAPMYITQTEKENEQPLDVYSKAIGQAFQIKDDILDYESTAEVLGKNTSDIRNNKSTYVTILGIDQAKEKLHACYKKACDALRSYGEKADFLQSLAEYVKDRIQ
ncbi:MAG TPA: farnesyl-diphosphate synthase [Clostridiales bacterium]|nr:farnesyl-diphosphate synthase [Clostridiales bacterium]